MHDNVLTVDPLALWDDPRQLEPLVKGMADAVFRTGLSQPGFAMADLGDDLTPARFRSMLIGFAAALDEAYQLGFSRRLTLRSIGRSDQKKSSEAHLDGAPDESILMLGYEPTEVASQLFIIDYTKCAADIGWEPQAFLEKYNPTFGDGRLLLEKYVTQVRGFDARHYRIVVINNSSRSLSDAATGMLGVLHKSTVGPSAVGQIRRINTLMMSPANLTADDLVPAEDVRAYIDRAAFGYW